MSFRIRLAVAHSFSRQAFAVDLDSHELSEVYADEPMPDVIDEIEASDCPLNPSGHAFLTQCGVCACVYCEVKA